MKMLLGILLCFACSVLQADEVGDLQKTLVFGEADNDDTAGYSKHWNHDCQSAWFSAKLRSVLVTDSKTRVAMKISDFPAAFGTITSTGWKKKDDRFFVCLARTPTAGVMIYLDLDKKKVLSIEPWGKP